MYYTEPNLEIVKQQIDLAGLRGNKEITISVEMLKALVEHIKDQKQEIDWYTGVATDWDCE